MKRITVIAGLLATFLLSSLISFAQTQSRGDMQKELRKKHEEIAVLEKQFLEPSEEDQARYAEFLRQPDTGLIRLLPRETFDSQTYRDAKKTMVVRGGGAYYSFVRLTHEYGFGSDLELDHSEFVVGFAGADFGFMTNLGDIPIESVGPDTRGVNVFATYKPPRAEEVARKEYRKLYDGTELEDVSVRSRVPVVSGATYLLRSINYRNSDVLVAFRVVRVDSDGSVVIAWKMLKKFGKPPTLTPTPTVGIG